MPKFVFNKNKKFHLENESGGPSNLLDIINPTIGGPAYYEAGEDLLLWARLSLFPNVLDMGGLAAAKVPAVHFSYEGIPSTGITTTGNNTFNIASFSDTANTNAKVAYGTTIGTALNFGSGTVDLPFSISLWFTHTSSGTTGIDYLLATAPIAAADFATYQIAYTPASKVMTFSLNDESTGGSLSLNVDTTSFNDLFKQLGKLCHLVVTYDGSGAGGMKMYFNGMLKGSGGTASGTYVAMERIATTLYIGAAGNGANEFPGDMAEIAVWKKCLSQSEISAVYYGSLYSTFVAKSGFISNPPRYLIRQFDSATGSYPTIARTGDVSRAGNYNVSFNDTNTVVFDDPYAEAEINFDMVFQTKIVPIATPGIYYGPVNSNILGEGYKEVIEPTIKETFLSPLDGDTITLVDTDGSSVVFTFKYGLNLSGLTSNQVQIPLNRYDRKLLAKNFAEKINEHPNIKIQATLLDEPKNLRLPGRNDAGKSESFANGTIKLRQQKPGAAGNKAITKSLTAPSIFGSIEGISITDFSGGKDITVKYSAGLVKNSNFKAFNQSYATPNFIDDTLNNSGGVVRKGIGDAHIRFTPGENLTAFKDNRIDIRSGKYYSEGTSDDTLPGYSSKLADKTQLVFDISSHREQHVFKQDGGIMNKQYPRGEYVNQDFTGFCYYNWSLGRWEQKGLNDPATGNAVDYQYGISKDDGPIFSASVNHVSQFTAPSGLGQLVKLLEDAGTPKAEANNAYGYNRACSPLVSHGAPAANMYHATSSQALKMSNYINAPYLLEKLTIDIPVFARMSHQAHPSTNIVDGVTTTHAGNDRAEYSKDMMNYVFFLYHQQRNDEKYQVDSQFSVTGSKRTLIASGAACFYNKSVYNRLYPGTFYDFEPQHSPSFKHGFDGGDASGIQEYTGSIRIEMIPAVTPQLANPWNLYPMKFISSVSNDPIYYYITILGTSFGNVQIPPVWYGGSSNNPFNIGDDKLSGKDNVIQLEYQRNNYIKEWDDTFGSKTDDIKIRPIINSRHGFVNALGGLGSTPFTKTTALGYQTVNSDFSTRQSGVSPFLLFPEDELILGVEKAGSEAAALLDVSGLFSNGNKKTFLPTSISGSLMTIQSGKAKMTFYGSQVKKGKEFHDTLNQPLNSNAIHEAIHYDNPVIDQYQIEPRTTYVGSFLDDRNESGFKIVLKNPASRIGSNITSIISGSFSGTTDSFTRYTQHHNFNQVFFDSMLPNIAKVMKSTSTAINSQTFPISYTGGYDNSNPNNAVSYPFRLTSKSGNNAAFKSTVISSIDNIVDFGNYLGTGGTNLGYLPQNFNVGLIGAAAGVKAAVRAAASGIPLPYYNESVGYATSADNFKFTYKVYNYSTLSGKSEIVHPFRNNPKRELSNTDELSLVVSELTTVNIEGVGSSEGASVTVNPDGSFGSSTSYRNAIFNAIEPKIEYVTGRQIPELLFGGTSAKFSETINNNEQFAVTSFLGHTSTIPDGTSAAWQGGKLKNITTNANIAGVQSFSLTNNRGLSYGLINVELQRNKTYMRSDRFTGQVADIVHSGYDTVFSNFVANLSDARLNLGVGKKSRPVNSPVSVLFVSGSSFKPQTDTKLKKFKLVQPTVIMENPSLQSSNVSLYATSSMPYFDDNTPRNRDYLDPTIAV